MNFTYALLVTLAVVFTPTFQEHIHREISNRYETKQYMFAEFESLLNIKEGPSCSSKLFEAGGHNCFDKESFEGPNTSLIDVSECTHVAFYRHTSCRTEVGRLVSASRSRILGNFKFESLNLTRIKGCQKGLDKYRIYQQVLADSTSSDEFEGSFLEENNKLSQRFRNLMKSTPNRRFTRDLYRLLD